MGGQLVYYLLPSVRVCVCMGNNKSKWYTCNYLCVIYLSITIVYCTCCFWKLLRLITFCLFTVYYKWLEIFLEIFEFVFLMEDT